MSATRPRALVSWSSGKDSAWALHVVRERADVEIAGLLTTISETHDRVAMHAVRRELLQAQADALGLPLWPVFIPNPCSNEHYEAAMHAVLERARRSGIDVIVFGDLFLEDIRAYREQKLAPTGIRPLFPLWQIPTDRLAQEMLAAGVRAHITCVDPKQVPRELAGQIWDAARLARVAPLADPCGERGEFHTFVSAGPMFRAELPVVPGPVVERDGFVFADLLLSS